jgi:hypothetical protein
LYSEYVIYIFPLFVLFESYKRLCGCGRSSLSDFDYKQHHKRSILPPHNWSNMLSYKKFNERLIRSISLLNIQGFVLLFLINPKPKEQSNFEGEKNPFGSLLLEDKGMIESA